MGLDSVVRVRVADRCAVAEVSDRLTGVLRATEQHSVGALGRTKGKLIEGDALTTSLYDSSTSSLGELKSCYGKLRNVKHTRIVRHATNNNSSLTLLAFHIPSKSGNRERWPVES